MWLVDASIIGDEANPVKLLDSLASVVELRRVKAGIVRLKHHSHIIYNVWPRAVGFSCVVLLRKVLLYYRRNGLVMSPCEHLVFSGRLFVFVATILAGIRKVSSDLIPAIY